MVDTGWSISKNRLLQQLITNPTNTMMNHGFTADYILSCMLDNLVMSVGYVQIIRDNDKIYRLR
ncbi:hypothetical protein IGL98_001832 [Enterococcus sp. DIV0840]